MHEHWAEFINLYPRTEPLETPVEVTKEKVETAYWGTQVRTNIKAIDNA